MPFPKLRITSDTIGTTQGARIFLDDIEIHGIKAVKLEGRTDDVWHLGLVLLPGALDVEIGGVLLQGSPAPQAPKPEPPKHRTIADAGKD